MSTRLSQKTDESLSLLDLYQRALRKLTELDNSTYNALTPEFQQLQKETLENMVAAGIALDRADVFSPDEVMEDVKTSDIQFMNYNFFLARIIERTPVDPKKATPDTRAAVVQLAARKYLEFLSLLDDYGAVTKFSRYAEYVQKLLPEGVKGKFNLSAVNPMQRNTSRTSKMETFKSDNELEKEYNVALGIFRNNHRQDEEAWRRVEKLRLQLHKRKAFNSLLELVDELMLLSGFSKEFGIAPLQEHGIAFVPNSQIIAFLDKITRPLATGSTFADVREARQHENLSDKLESTKVDPVINSSMFGQANPRVTGPKGEVLRPFVILPSGQTTDASRAEAMANVFGTGQKLPTMTLDELVERELAHSIGPGSGVMKPEIDLDSDAVADAETMKARQWDDFTESVAKGSGNTLNLG